MTETTMMSVTMMTPPIAALAIVMAERGGEDERAGGLDSAPAMIAASTDVLESAVEVADGVGLNTSTPFADSRGANGMGGSVGAD